MGARLLKPNGDGFWTAYDDPNTRQDMGDFWQDVIDAGGDEPTPASRRLRRRLMIEHGLWEPEDDLLLAGDPTYHA